MNKHSLVLLMMTVIILFSCKGDKPQNEVENILDIAMLKEPSMLNPILSPNPTERIVFHNLFIPLSDFHPETYELTPILIKEIPEGKTITDGPYKGGTQYTIEIKDEAKWDNGSPITAKDLEFTIKSIKHPETNTGLYNSYLKWVSDFKVDPNNNKKGTFYFKDYYMLAKELALTLEVYPQYHYDPDYALDDISMLELDGENAKALIDANPKLKAFAEAFNGVKFARESISGSGPYKFKKWESKQIIILEKKENYWGAGSDNPFLMAKPDELRFHMISDETAMITQLKEGNIDLCANMSGNTFFDLKENETYGDKFQYFTPELMKYYYIAINNSRPELADPKVRRALSKLMDIPKLTKVLEGGLGKQTVGPFNIKKPYYNNDLVPLSLDLEGAANILSSEGWEDTNNDGSVDKVINGEKIELDLDIYVTKSQLSTNIALILQENAKAAGIKINIITKEWKKTKPENLKKRNYDLIPLSASQDLVIDDPYMRWHSDSDDPALANYMSYRSDEADVLMEKIRSTRDDNERNKYYTEFQKIIYDDQPVIFLYSPQEKIIVSKDWKASSTIKRPGYYAGTFELIK